MKLTTVQHNGQLKPFGRTLALRMLLEKFSPPQGQTCATNKQGKEDIHMCFDLDDLDQDTVEEQEQTDVPATSPVPVTDEQPVAA